jgi:hypothetical protein
MADNLTIKPAQDPNTNPANQAGQSAAGQTAAQPVAQSAQNPATNKRAINLSAEVEESDKNLRRPEKYAIPKIVWDKYPDMVELIKQTESMDDEEREYWFQVLPIMTDHQVEKFRTILNTEKNQLAALDQEYEQELQKLNEKHMIEWKEFESKEKRKAIQSAEATQEKTEAKTEEELLAKLSQL